VAVDVMSVVKAVRMSTIEQETKNHGYCAMAILVELLLSRSKCSRPFFSKLID